MKYLNLGPRASTIRPQHAGACHNCHAPVSQKFCGQCGQNAHAHVASAHEFIHHFVGHYVAAEGKLWRTLLALLFRPGQLTLEFVRGRRGQFIDPLRLLLTISLVAFLVMKLIPVVDPKSSEAPQPAKTSATQKTKKDELPAFQSLVYQSFKYFSPSFEGNYEKLRKLPEKENTEVFVNVWMSKGPTIALLLIPVVAAWLKLAQLGTGWRYGEHLVFAFHLLSYSLLAVSTAAMISVLLDIHAIWMAAIASVPLYLLVAMRKVYGGNWLLVAARWGFVGYLSVMSFKFCVWIAIYSTIATMHFT